MGSENALLVELSPDLWVCGPAAHGPPDRGAAGCLRRPEVLS